ncbi:MAG: transposase [Planctomycetaceae bacterium]|nr:transposase [Planctomycetaceae bacterium]
MVARKAGETAAFVTSRTPILRWQYEERSLGILGNPKKILLFPRSQSMGAKTGVDAQAVGALPLVGAMLTQCGLAGIVDLIAYCEGDAPLGTLVDALVMNHLLNPQAMYDVGNWASETAVTDFFGLMDAELNDDRFGRSLERIKNETFDRGMSIEKDSFVVANTIIIHRRFVSTPMPNSDVAGLSAKSV